MSPTPTQAAFTGVTNAHVPPSQLTACSLSTATRSSDQMYFFYSLYLTVSLRFLKGQIVTNIPQQLVALQQYLLKGQIENLVFDTNSQEFVEYINIGKALKRIKVKNLKTYTGKKAKYLYIDVEAFLRNEEGLRLIDMDTNQIILNLMYPKLEAELKRIKMIKKINLLRILNFNL